ncbi:MAG: hypothetical protein HOQ33_19450 [Cupriavidus sp.]|nr:hypothetical protein [Cupriavidus sp.]
MSADLFSDPVVHEVGRTLLALLFLTGAASKALAFDQFTGTLAAYRLIPEAGARAAALAVVCLEALSGVLSLQWFAVAGGAWMPVAFLGLVTLAAGVNLARGHVDIDCGCGGTQGASKLSWAIVVRNAALIAIAAGLTHAPAERALSLLDGLSIAGGAISCFGVYVAFSQLTANGPVSQSARQHP